MMNDMTTACIGTVYTYTCMDVAKDLLVVLHYSLGERQAQLLEVGMEPFRDYVPLVTSTPTYQQTMHHLGQKQQKKLMQCFSLQYNSIRGSYAASNPTLIQQSEPSYIHCN